MLRVPRDCGVTTTVVVVVVGDDVEEDSVAAAAAAALVVAATFSTSSEGSVLLQAGLIRVSTSNELAFCRYLSTTT